jgi:aspartyl protease family protein
MCTPRADTALTRCVIDVSFDDFVVKMRRNGGAWGVREIPVAKVSMPDTNGPWHKPPAARSSTSRFVALALIIGGALAIWELWRLFPGALADTTDQARLVQYGIILAAVASGVVYSRRFTARETFRNIAIWAGIAIVLVLGYTFYDRIKDAAGDAKTALVPSYPSEMDANTMVFSENRDGDFDVIGSVNGHTVEFMVDTGASDIVLSPDDAQRAGIDMSSLHYIGRYETANGEGRGAPYTLDTLEIGPVKLFNVPVSINQTKMHASLLGMAFLKRMKSFEMKGQKLYLRWR